MAMRKGESRIPTTHVGSLIRPPALLEFIRSRQGGQAYDQSAYEECLSASVADVVQRQAATGLDIVSDGEFGKSISWSQYALTRLSGFERRPTTPGEHGFNRGADRARFADFYKELDAADGPPAAVGASAGTAICTGPITYVGQTEIQRDIDNVKSALSRTGGVEAFLPVAAPSSVIPDRKNEYYESAEDLSLAIADAMRTEYRAIMDAGLNLQLDDARLAVTFDRMVPPATFEDYRHWVARQVELINHALEGLPEERIRYHVCWGSWPGPHTTDVPLRAIVDLVLKVRAGTYLIEGANPRHEHEWRVWESVSLPEGKRIAPGVISHSTNVVEHPELVSERLVRIGRLVGRENILASTDCGFAQGPFHRRVHSSIMWAKLESLVEGARLASRQLWRSPSKSRYTSSPMQVSQSSIATATPAEVQAAREALDVWVREIVEWHFNPATGSPFWLDYASKLGWDPRREINGYADLYRLGEFQDEWLRGGPVQRWIPKALAGRPTYVFETGGTTGIPKSRVGINDFRIDYEYFSKTLPDEYFPQGANWLMLGPSGPRRLRLSVEHLAQHRGNGICFCVDLDPRWVIKLIKKGWSEHLQAYKDHVIDQGIAILQANHDIKCMFTTPKLLEALALRLETMGTTIRKVGITGIFSGGTEFTPQWNRFAHEELLDGAYMTPTYGNTLMGLAASAPSGPHNNYKIAYYAPQPRAVTEVVDFDDANKVVEYGETGRVKLTTLTKEFFMPGFLERDEGEREPPYIGYPWDGVSGVRPYRGFASSTTVGVY